MKKNDRFFGWLVCASGLMFTSSLYAGDAMASKAMREPTSIAAEIVATRSIKDPIAYWSFDASVIEKNGLQSVAQGNPKYVAGSKGLAIDLNGTDQFVVLTTDTLSSIYNMAGSSFAYSFWYKSTGMPDGSWDKPILSNNSSFGVNFSRQDVSLSNPSVDWNFVPGATKSVDGITWTSADWDPFPMTRTATPENGNWNHFVMNYSKETKKLQLYINGVKTEDIWADVPWLIRKDKPMWLGFNDNQNRFLQGQLDEVYVYPFALTTIQVDSLFHDTGTEVLPTATDMKAVKVGTDINLTWKDNATNELGYWIYRAVKISDTEFLGSTKIGEVAANVSSFTDTTVSVTNKKNYVYSVVAYSQLGLSLESDKAEIVLTGLNELNVPDFKVYQNPAEKTLMVTADNEISSIALYDLTGRTITSVAPNAKTSKLSLNNFMNGIYVLRVKMGNIVYNRKILITK